MAAGHELALGLRVCLYEEYLAATHHLRKDQGRISTFHLYGNASQVCDSGRSPLILALVPSGKTVPRQPDKEHRRIVAGTITRILPGNFSCEGVHASLVSACVHACASAACSLAAGLLLLLTQCMCVHCRPVSQSSGTMGKKARTFKRCYIWGTMFLHGRKQTTRCCLNLDES